MSHHSSEPPFEKSDFQKAMEQAEKRMHKKMGELLGEYPDGKMNVQDEGAVAMLVQLEEGKIVIRFPKPVAWVGFTEVEAMQLAQTLVDLSKQISKSPFSLRL